LTFANDAIKKRVTLIIKEKTEPKFWVLFKKERQEDFIGGLILK